MALNQRTPSYEDLRGLSIVYVRAIALAWTDDDVGRKFRQQLMTDGLKALEEYFNYVCPFSIDLEFRETPPESRASWVPTTKAPDGKIVPGYWSALPPNEIVYNLPTQPAKMYDEAIALSSYIDGGPGYLFSCC